MWRIIIFALLASTIADESVTWNSSAENPQKPQTPAKEPIAAAPAASSTEIVSEMPATSSAAPSTPLATTTSSEKPSTAIIPEIEDEPSSNRRVITYDQRQEGQYNIRADLENFMIVLIPAGASEGANLLDLLTKNSFRRNSYGGGKAKYKYKEPIYSSSSGLPSSSSSSSTKYRQSIKTGSNNQNFNFLGGGSRQQGGAQQPAGGGSSSSSTSGGNQHHPLSIVDSSATRLSDFIEGRTPYRVDISSSDGEQARLHPDRQVDVLPPPYPLTYQHLIKPFHLEAEPTVIQALPPQGSASGISSSGGGGGGSGGAGRGILGSAGLSSNSGNFMETYNQLFASRSLGHGSDNYYNDDDGDNNNNDDNDNDDDGGENVDGDVNYRINRAIGGGNNIVVVSPNDGDIFNGYNFGFPLDSNRVSQSRSSSHSPSSSIYDSWTSSNSHLDDNPSAVSRRRSHLPVYTEGRIYPAIEVPRLSGFLKLSSNSRTIDDNLDKGDNANDDDADLAEIPFPSKTSSAEISENDNFKLSNPDLELVLLGATEDCGPDRRRDSYGICRLVAGY